MAKTEIELLEDAVRDHLPLYNTDNLTSHYFAPGIYVRQMLIPAGTVLTGKIHRTELMNILVFGTIRVTVGDGSIQDVSGPLIFNSPPGSKKAGFAVTDVMWLNVHPTESTDLEEIERVFTADSYEALAYQPAEVITQDN